MEKSASVLSDKEAEKIVQEYGAVLNLPNDKPDTQILLCPIGLLGSGKTTVLKPLSKKFSLARISTDDIRKMLYERGYNYDRAKELTFTLAEKYIQQGYSVAIDSDCVSQESRDYIQNLKKTYNLQIFWIHINPPEEYILNKLKKYKHTWLFKNAEHAIENYYHRKPLHKNLTFPFIYTFDPSKSDIAQQIEEAVQLIRDVIKKALPGYT